MEKGYYFITWKPAFLSLVKSDQEEAACEKLIVSISQGGFGQDVVDEVVQVKQRFMDFACQEYGVELPRTADCFDEYFELVEADYFVDLDEYS
ncbi:MAG: hypothetical protein RMM17_11455 [Acidobacteriota bacterium]|nr:hypothetical protein [Blastocatellia bacterium]MDW8413288.1 hypothetical protein [Acidobacteriota bacterium]